jgi:hypothetical protein
MSVVIKGRDFFNLREQAIIDLLEVRPGKGTGLGGSERCRKNNGAEQESAPDLTYQFHDSLRACEAQPSQQLFIAALTARRHPKLNRRSPSKVALFVKQT